jgi:hypothetical protein
MAMTLRLVCVMGTRISQIVESGLPSGGPDIFGEVFVLRA